MTNLSSKWMKYIVLSTILMSGVMGFVSSALSMEKVHFNTSDGEKFWCDRNDLDFYMDENGKLSSICNPMPEDGAADGTSAETAFELNVDGKLFRKYILNIFRYGKVAFKNAADAENTLMICEDMGLPLAEEHICKALKRKPRKETKDLDLGVQKEQFAHQNFNQDCPEGYVLVPGNELYHTPEQGEDFCIMKYGASRGSDGKAISRQGELPWVNINRASAEAACRANGEGYYLTKNAQWTTVGREIEANPENWSEGQVGVGILSRGNSNSNQALASGPDANPYFGLAAEFNNDWTHKRTHTFSNGEVIWDIAGNVWEWVAESLTSTGNGGQEYSEMHDNDINRILFGPHGPYNRTFNTGRLWHGTAGAVLRGGAWNNETNAGVFAANLDDSATNTYNNVGFRCAFSASGAR